MKSCAWSRNARKGPHRKLGPATVGSWSLIQPDFRPDVQPDRAPAADFALKSGCFFIIYINFPRCRPPFMAAASAITLLLSNAALPAGVWFQFGVDCCIPFSWGKVEADSPAKYGRVQNQRPESQGLPINPSFSQLFLLLIESKPIILSLTSNLE